MNDDLKLRYSQLKENDPANKDVSSAHDAKAYDEFYSDRGHVRNVCFVLLDSRRIFMNYSYLVSGEYIPNESAITLTFTTHLFLLTGANLENLFYDLMHNYPMQIICKDKRYNIIGSNESFVVNDITQSKI